MVSMVLSPVEVPCYGHKKTRTRRVHERGIGGYLKDGF